MYCVEDFPYRFDSEACEPCRGNCCRGAQGYVWVGMQEIEKMADILGMDPASFAGRYVRRVAGRFSLKERMVNGEHLCCFFDAVDCRCTVYESRPKQCRTYPFWNEFKKNPQKLILECPGARRSRCFKDNA
jgi:Fe-S-cluster containining protein